MGDEDRVSALLGDWLDRRERGGRGEEADPEELIRAHPELADELRKGLRALECVELLFQDPPTDTSPVPERIGAYQIDRELGSGGMGTVYLAQETDGEPVALKVVHPHLLERSGFFKRFLREAEIGKRVVHKNVVRTLDVDAVKAGSELVHFLVMEYVEGQTLRELVDDLKTVPEELCRHIGREIARGLAAVHEAGVVHRDVKPENVLITRDHAVKIMDLGVAHLQDEAIRLSRTGHFVGSIHYAAPEQFRSGGADVDGRADLHALGVILYELATGLQPFYDEDARVVLRRVLDEAPRPLGEVNPQVSPFFEEVVRTLLAKEREGRFDAAATLLEVLEGGEKSAWWKERARALRVQTNRPLRRIRVPRETALYGRDEDLAKLRATYERAKNGEGQVLLIEGEAGIGKTRLVDEFVGLLQREGEDLNFLFGSYPPGGAATTSGAFSTAYREHFGEEGLDQTLGAYLTVTPLLIPVFAALLTGEPPPQGEQPLTKDSLQTVFVHATRALAAERPTIVLIEDLHFAPEEGRALFAALALAVPGHRILLVGTLRPGVPETWTANLDRLDQASRMELSRLGAKDLARLLKDAFRSDRLAEQLGLKIAEKSDGNPFFVFEIIRGLKEGQLITQRPDGTWATTQVIRDFEVPSSVLDLVNARVADLDDEERTLLDVASCCGFEFDPTLVAAAVGIPPVPALQHLGRIEKHHRLVRSAGRDYVFDHHQVQEALYDALNGRLREHYHAALGEALERLHGTDRKDPKDLDGAVAVALCEHYLKGAQGARALLFFDSALDHLDAAYLHHQSIGLMDRALGVPGLLEEERRAIVLMRMADRLGLVGQTSSDRAAREEAVAIADESRDPGLRAKAHRALGHFLELASATEPALAELHLALDLARTAEDPTVEAYAHNCAGGVHFRAGRLDEAQEHYEHALTLSVATGDRRMEGSATLNLGLVLYHHGDYREARARVERAMAIGPEIGLRDLEACCARTLGSIVGPLDGAHAGRAWTERALELYRKAGHRRGEAATLCNLGINLHTQGHEDEAQARLEQSVEVCREVGDGTSEGNAWRALGDVAMCLGQHAQARDHHQRSLELAREVGDRSGEMAALARMPHVLACLGQCDDARGRVGTILALSDTIAERPDECYAVSSVGKVLYLLGDHEKAGALLHRGLELARQMGDRRMEALSLGTLGGLFVETNRAEEADVLLGQAEALAQELHCPDLLLHARAWRANLPGGDVDLAVTTLKEFGERIDVDTRMGARYQLFRATGDCGHMKEAKRLLDDVLDRNPQEYRESMLANVPHYRDIMRAWEEHGEHP